jgi:hypothetical protein
MSLSGLCGARALWRSRTPAFGLSVRAFGSKPASEKDEATSHNDEGHAPFNWGADSSYVPGREYLREDGQRANQGFALNENYHEFFDHKHRDPYVVPQNLVRERGTTWVKGVELSQERFEDAWGTKSAPGTLPYLHRNRMNVYGNYGLVMKLEFFFFYVPVLITLGFIMPIFTMAFAVDEAVYTTMTVKVTGRQWYWVYEIESPPEDDESEE